MHSMKLVIPLYWKYWSIYTKDESKRGTAFAFIFGVNWLWRRDVTTSFGVSFHEIKCYYFAGVLGHQGRKGCSGLPLGESCTLASKFSITSHLRSLGTHSPQGQRIHLLLWTTFLSCCNWCSTSKQGVCYQMCWHFKRLGLFCLESCQLVWFWITKWIGLPKENKYSCYWMTPC